jgi:hypothetical protein
MRRDLALRFAEVGRQQGAPPSIAERSAASSPWMSTLDLAEFLRLTSRRRPREAALAWARRHHLVGIEVNRENRFARRDVEVALLHAQNVGRRVA